MEVKYDTYTKDEISVSYLLYTLLFELGLNPSNKGTIYLKGIIEYVFEKNLYDYSYKEILKSFIKDNYYEKKSVHSNIKNSLYRIDYIKAERNFEKHLHIPFDSYYLSPSKFINIIALNLKYKV